MSIGRLVLLAGVGIVVLEALGVPAVSTLDSAVVDPIVAWLLESRSPW